MREVSLREANQNFSSCIAEVEAGEHIILTRRGEPVAELVPYTGKKADPKKEAAWQEILKILDAGLDFGGVPFTYDERHER